MTIRVVCEPLTAERFDQAMGLAPAHWDELAQDKHILPLAPDRERYLAAAEQGVLVCVFVFDDERMVGYSASCLVQAHLHSVDACVAQCTALYLAPEYRGRTSGTRLLFETERNCKVRGAQMLVVAAKPGTPLTAMLPEIGYRMREINYSKEL